MSVANNDAPQGTLAERYQLTRLLGWGAHGEVYQAQDLQIQEPVAVKIFFSSREDVTRFVQKELNSISKLSHPNLLPFRDFGECEWKGEPVHYIVTPYMEGGNLALHLKKLGPMAPEKAVDVVLQLAQALSYMHSRNFLHRDIKPANILLDNRQNAVLSDFSISCSPETPATGPLGTPDYSPPEQMSDFNSQHPRIDIYGLGITLYEMIAGSNPFREISKKHGQVAAIQSKYFDDRISLLSERNHQVPQELALIVRQMMSSDPEHRYQDMTMVIQALLPFASSAADIFAETDSLPIPKPESVRWKSIAARGWHRSKQLFIDWRDHLYWPYIWQLYWRKKLRIGDPSDEIAEEVAFLFAKAQNLRSESKWEQALGVYHHLRMLEPEHVRMLNHLGDTLLKLKKYRQARALFDQALLIDPKYYSAYCNRGFAYVKLRRYDRAIIDYDVAIALEKDKPEAYFYRAHTRLDITRSYIETSDFQNASRSYQQMQRDLLLARKLVTTTKTVLAANQAGKSKERQSI